MKQKDIAITIFFIIMLISPIIYRLYFKQTEKMIDLSDYTIEEVINYANEEELDLTITKIYSNEVTNKVVHQSIKTGSIITKNDELIVKISIGHLSGSQLREKNVNELGEIPIMLYHGIIDMNNNDTGYTGGNVDINGYNRTTEAFIEDLKYYYNNSYRMISLNDYFNGVIDVEFGKSPIIITFDGGQQNNFNIIELDEDENLVIDENSAIGILETFKNEYADYNVTATFLLDSELFHQPEFNDKILIWLEANNYTYYIEGVDKEYDYLKSGRIPSYSPFTTNFNKLSIERCKAWDNNGKVYDIEMNFKTLNTTRYISDGNPNTIAYPKDVEEQLKNTYDLKKISY